MFKYVLKKFFSQAGSYFFVLMTLLSFVITSINPFLNGKFIDFLVYNINVDKIFCFSVLIMLVGILGVLISYFTNVQSIKIMNNTSFGLLHETLKDIEHTKLNIIEKIDSSYMTQKLISDVNLISNFVIANFITVFLNILAIIGIIGIFLYVDTQLLIIAILLLIPYIFIYAKIKNPLYTAFVKKKEAESCYFSDIYSQINQVFNIQINSSFDESSSFIQKAYFNYFPNIINAGKLGYLFTSADTMIAILFQSIMFVYGGICIINKQMSIGEFTMINTYFSLLLKTIKYYINYFKDYQDAKVSYQRVCEIKSYEKMKNGEITTENISNIYIKSLSFSFENRRTLFNNISYYLEKGHIYTVIGSYGSGKSTLLKIMLMLYEDYQGEILVNGVNIKNINMKNARKTNYAVVPQKLFAQSVKTIDFLNQKHTILQEEKKSLFSEDIIKFIDKPMNLLSGGELRKLYLNIAFSNNKDVIILDEPTTELDVNSKIEFINYLKQKKQESLILIITHDKDLVSLSDNVIHIEDYKSKEKE